MSNKLLFRLAVLVTAMMCALDASAAKAYVFYTSSDSTLTFYYDNLMWSREGGLPGELNTGDNYPDWLNSVRGGSCGVRSIICKCPPANDVCMVQGYDQPENH